MKPTAPLLILLAVAATAHATPITIWVNDFSTLDGVTVPDPNVQPYLYDGGAWVDCLADGPCSHILEIQMCDLQAEQAYDLTYGNITIELQVEGDGLIPDESSSVWARFYSRVWNDDTGQWEFSGSQHYFYQVENTSETYGFGPGWQTFVRDLDDWDETDACGPFYSDQVYKFRLDYLPFAVPPYRLGISHCEIVAPECPHDLDGDDDVDLADLALLLGEYGCAPTTTVLYDSDGFEAFNNGDIDGQDGWQNVGNDSTGIVMDDPTGGGMGKVVQMDATNGTGGLVAIQRLIDTPVTTDIVIYDWDQYREDLGDNVWLCDDVYYDGWWAIQWDISDPYTTSAAYWPGPGAQIHEDVWEHVCYELNLDTGKARVQVDGGDWSDDAVFETDDMKGVELEISDTGIEGNGAVYFDNLLVSVRQTCAIDYDEDGDTDLSDLAVLLASYGCGTE